MGLGPIEVLVVGFPGSQFNGKILPALKNVVERDIVSIVDCLIVSKDVDGSVLFVELEDAGANEDVAALAELVGEANGLLSEEDVHEIAVALQPGDTAAFLVFEHTWAKPFRDAIVASGGVLVANVRIPGMVVDEVMAELAEVS
ncbi:MAG TPA: DUF6325 family protein [Acidimicrobiia bacterium]|nr:DUF6325 family protein [Acidimicrobiia bacterium]